MINLAEITFRMFPPSMSDGPNTAAPMTCSGSGGALSSEWRIDVEEPRRLARRAPTHGETWAAIHEAEASVAAAELDEACARLSLEVIEEDVRAYLDAETQIPPFLESTHERAETAYEQAQRALMRRRKMLLELRAALCTGSAPRA